MRRGSEDAEAAVKVARTLGDPALLLECLTVLLDVNGSDALLDEARQTAQRILAALSQQSLRSAFLTSFANKHPHVVDQ